MTTLPFKKNIIRVMKIFVIAPGVCLFLLLNFFLTIRLGKIRSSRIGHFAGNTQLLLCLKNETCKKRNKYLDIYFHEEIISNHYLLKIWKRHFFIMPKFFSNYLYLVHTSLEYLADIFPYLQKIIIDYGLTDIDYRNSLSRHPKDIYLTDSENEMGKNLLQEMGIPPNSKIVLLHVRDSAYLKKSFPDQDFSYHDYRDSDIDNFKKAANYLVSEGFFVFRMGVVCEKPLNVKNKMIIDYCYDHDWSDFLDIYLASKCDFIITNGTGSDAISSYIFRKPILNIDVLVQRGLLKFRKGLTTFVKYFDSSNSKQISLREINEIGVNECFSNECILKHGINIQRLDSDEILNYTKDMVSFVRNNFGLDDKYIALNEKFLNTYISSLSQNELLEKSRVFEGYLCPTFLKSYRSWYQ